MTAKEMFEKLGFYKTVAIGMPNICYARHSEKDKPYFDIAFYLNRKEYHLLCPNYDPFITIEMHKAIHQQIKELGWVE